MTSLEVLSIGESNTDHGNDLPDSADDPSLDPSLLAAVSALTALTSLQLGVCDKQQLGKLQQLHKLQQLQVCSAVHAPGVSLQLGQLTALTQLWFSRSVSEHVHLAVEAGDVLPPNLHSLTIADCSSAQLLQGLKQLTYLQVWGAKSTAQLADVLQHLPCLNTLEFSAPKPPSVGAAAMAQTPTLLGAPHRLRCLTISILPHSAAITTVAEVVRQLTGLEALTLRNVMDVNELVVPEQEAVQQLVAAASGLPWLQKLSMFGFMVDLESAKWLGAATSRHLTTLQLTCTCLTDFNLAVICSRLTQLVQLCVEGNGDLVLRDLLPFMERFMPRLARLKCDEEVLESLPDIGRELIDSMRRRADH
jgi:hypothetical protein